MTGIKILGTGVYLPKKTVTNEDFTKIIETSDEWISTRTGIKERKMSQGEPTWYMGSMAAKNAVKNAGINPEEIGLIIDTSVTPDFFTPSNACLIQRELGITGCMAMDVNCACAGFVYALDMAKRYLQTEPTLKYVLLVANETLSKLTDFEDRGTCVLFGDGAAACVVELREDSLYTSSLHADGMGAKYLCARAVSTDNAFMPEEPMSIDDGIPASNGHYFYMDGKEVYKFAVKALPDTAAEAAKKIDMDINDVDVFVPHQANIRIIQTAAKNLGVSMDKFYVNLDKYGNTSSVSIPLALHEAIEDGTIKRGNKICLVGFGAGLTSAAVIMEY